MSTKQIFHTALLFCFCLIVYSGILHHGWHLDDSGNILTNAPLHIADLQPATLFKTFYAHPETAGRLYRPIANFTFALNWFFGQDSPVGYHLVDIFIHFLTAAMLYLCFLRLLQTPACSKNWSEIYRTEIALLAAAFWIAAPIHTSAVTYIVQRMAQLAAFFSVSAIYYYLRVRLSINRVQQARFLICFLCCAVLALGSKENAVLLFPSFLLIEGIFFFQFQKILATIRRNKVLWLPLAVAIAVGAVFIVHYIEIQSHNYGHRSFTLSERMLTEPRILLFYLSQIFFPAASRLSIAHDINLSTSLFSPWYTLPALGACIGLILFSFLKLHKSPLLSFAILYFFLNHLVESTILPLELIFEHRNLLPSLFLFLPVAAFAVHAITKMNRSAWITPIVLIACASFLLQSGLATIERNKAWKDAGTLNQDAVNKAPKDARSRINLAAWHLDQKNYTEALRICEQAEKLYQGEASINTIVPVALNQRGTVAYEQGNLKKASQYFQQAYSLRKDYTAVAEKLIATLVELQRYEEALAIIAERIAIQKDPKLLLLKASILLRQNKPAESLAAYRQARPLYPALPLITAGEGKALMLSGYHDRAAVLLNWAVQDNEPIAKLLQIENSLLSGAEQEADRLLQQLLQTVPLVNLLNDLAAPEKDVFLIPINKELLRKAVLDAAAALASSQTKEHVL